MNHFKPHLTPRPTFEGYYSKFTLPSSAQLVLVICSVPGATKQPHMVSFTYVPPTFPQDPHFQREIWADDILMLDHSAEPTSSQANPVVFEAQVPNVGHMKVHADGQTYYDIRGPDGSFAFIAHVFGDETRTPWRRGVSHSTPESWLINLPLPLHWHVHTLSSQCMFTVDITPTYKHLHDLDHFTSSKDLNSSTSLSLKATVHQEKNWAHSFPTSHIWIQASNPTSKTYLNIAGGSIIGTQAYLLTYHAADPTHDITFTPPWSMAPSFAPSLSPTMSASIDWESRSVKLIIAGWRRKIEVEAHAEKGTFIGISAPFNDGHRDNALGQTYRAKVRVRIWEWRRGWVKGEWGLLVEEGFENAALEFGGEIYGAAGSEVRVH